MNTRLQEVSIALLVILASQAKGDLAKVTYPDGSIHYVTLANTPPATQLTGSGGFASHNGEVGSVAELNLSWRLKKDLPLYLGPSGRFYLWSYEMGDNMTSKLLVTLAPLLYIKATSLPAIHPWLGISAGPGYYLEFLSVDGLPKNTSRWVAVYAAHTGLDIDIYQNFAVGFSAEYGTMNNETFLTGQFGIHLSFW